MASAPCRLYSPALGSKLGPVLLQRLGAAGEVLEAANGLAKAFVWPGVLPGWRAWAAVTP